MFILREFQFTWHFPVNASHQGTAITIVEITKANLHAINWQFFIDVIVLTIDKLCWMRRK